MINLSTKHLHNSFYKHLMHSDALDAFWCTLMHFDACSHMHQNACRMNCAKFFSAKNHQISGFYFFLMLRMSQYVSECIKMYAEWIVKMFCSQNYHKSAFVTLKWDKICYLVAKNSTFTSECSKCINMHQNTSKCMQNELCKGFVHEIIKEVVFITF